MFEILHITKNAYFAFIYITAVAIKCIACTTYANYAECQEGDEGRKVDCPSTLDYASCKKEIKGKHRIELVVQGLHINIIIWI